MVWGAKKSKWNADLPKKTVRKRTVGSPWGTSNWNQEEKDAKKAERKERKRNR